MIRFDFPARGTMPPVQIFWYDGTTGPQPRPQSLSEEEKLGDLPRVATGGPGAAPRPGAGGGYSGGGAGRNGNLFVGDKGFLTTGTYGENTRLLPAERMADYKMPPQFLTRSPGHYRDWIRAAKGGERSCSDFSIAGPFTNGFSSACSRSVSKGSSSGIARKCASPTMPRRTS